MIQKLHIDAHSKALRLFCGFGLLWFLVLPINAQEISSIPGAFAQIGIGARSAGLGYTGTAGAIGSGAMAWNPAAIYSDNGMELALSYVDQLEVVEFGYAALSIPLKNNRNAIAISAHYSGDEALTEESAKVAYAHRIGFIWLGAAVGIRRAMYGKNKLNAGDYVVFDADEIAEGLSRQVSGTATGYTIEAGMRMMWSRDLAVSLSARNISAPMLWRSYSQARPGKKSYIESVPLELATGVKYQLSDRVSGALEWVPALESDAISRIGLGASFLPVEMIALRVGRVIFHDGIQNETNTFGFGIRTPKSAGLNIRADYAYIISDLARTQQLSLSIGL